MIILHRNVVLKKSSFFYLFEVNSVYLILSVSASHFQHDWPRAQQFFLFFIEITQYLRDKKIIMQAEYLQEVPTPFCNNCHVIYDSREIKSLRLLPQWYQLHQFAK